MADDFLFKVDGLEPDELLVTRFTGTEEISEIYQFDIELVSLNKELDFDQVIGKNASLQWKTAGEEREINGIAARLEQLGTGHRFTSYRVRLVPKLWTLGLRHQSRIFQDQSIPDIVEKVFEGAGIVASDFSMEVSGSHSNHTYCVQYRETDLDFVMRLLEEEGIYFFFRHQDQEHVMVLADKLSIHTAISGEPEVPYRTGGPEVSIEHVRKLRTSQQLETGAVVLRDYNFEKPTVDISSAPASADKETEYEYYDYPGDYSEKSVGDGLAQIRLEEIRSRRIVASGESSCRRLEAGSVFELADHPRGDFNGKHLLVSLEHWGSQPQSVSEEQVGSGEEPIYYNNFTCIPASVQFRPARDTVRPVVEGPQTAVVTGPEGEEVWPNKYGCVKVQFHWDREGKKNEKSSCWVRVGQNWAGPGWGGLFTPRLGMEVIVDFMEGNPDLPMITGCVYNGANPLPYKLPDDKTRSTVKSDSSLGSGGDNEFRFEDKAGQEEVFLHAQKDWNTVVGNDKSEDVGHDQAETVGNDKSESVGSNETISIGKNRSETVGGNESLNVSGSRTRSVAKTETVSVGAARTHSVGANESINVGAAQEIAVGAAQVVGVGAKQTISVGDDQKVDVGKDREVQIGEKDLLKVGKDIAIEAGKSLTIKVGKAKIVMKDDGTVQIQGKDITVKGSGAINVKASKDVSIKGKKIKEN